MGLRGDNLTCQDSQGYSFHGRNPTIQPCNLHAKKDAYTTDPTKVTCARCQDWLTYEATEATWAATAELHQAQRPSSVRDSNVRYWSNWRDDKTLIKEAWLLCCGHAGAPCPLAADELEDERRRALADKIKLPTAFFSQTTAELEEAVEALTSLDAGLVNALQPAIDACTLAGDLLLEVRRLYDEAKAHVAQVKQAVLDGETARTVTFDALAKQLDADRKQVVHRRAQQYAAAAAALQEAA